MAKSSISFEELTHDDSKMARRKDLMGGCEEQSAQKDVVSFLYIALWEAARKTVLDRKPSLDTKNITIKELLKEANDTFLIKKSAYGPT